MGMFDLFRRSAPAVEKRAEYVGPTQQIIAARAEYLFGSGNVAEMTATVQACADLWANGLAMADVDGFDGMGPRELGMTGRALALTGECLWIVRPDGRLTPATDWAVQTRGGEPVAYRVTVADVSGGRAETVLAGEVVHFRIAATPSAPWQGRSPLSRASLSATALAAVETALRDVYANAPLGSSTLPMPESEAVDLDAVSRGLVGYRGRVLVRESVNVQAAGGPVPTADWAVRDLTPDLVKAGLVEAHGTARATVCAAFGVLPSWLSPDAQANTVREAQRQLATWTLQPIAAVMAQEMSAKSGAPVEIDTLRPLQAYDVNGRARALATIVESIATAKENGLTQEEMNAALTMVNWGSRDSAA